MSRKNDNRVLWWAALGFVFLLSGWIAIFSASARLGVAEVPIESPALPPNR